MFVQSRPAKAVVFQDREYTYDQLLQYSRRYSKFFSQSSPEKVMIFAENSPEWIFSFFGIVRSGAISVPVDVQSTVKDVAYILADCKPEIIFTTEAHLDLVNEACAQSQHQCKIVTAADVDVSGIENEMVTDIAIADKNRVAVIVYTSGTTGSPKGVMLSYKNLLFNVDAVSKGVPYFVKDQHVLILLPLHHVLPLVGTLIAPLYVGGCVYIAEGMNAESIIKTLNQGQINMFVGVPRLYELLVNGIMSKVNSSAIARGMFKTAKAIHSRRLSKVLFRSVQKKFGGHIDYLISGGAALPVHVSETLQTLGFTVCEGYGMSECAPMITFPRPWNLNTGYAGEPLVDEEVMIDENGEVCVKGDNVMIGYYNRPEETAAIIRDGWLHTGDTGILNEKGLKLTGRIKEIIVTPNGKNINPEEVETELVKTHGQYIKEVGVFMKDDILQCIIVPNLTNLREKSIENLEDVLKEEIGQFNQTMEQYKRIKKIHITSEELPKTRMMKLQRFKLADLIQEKKREEVADTKERSKIYLMLQQFIETETKHQAGENDHFEIDLAIDSLCKVTLLSFIEEHFGISMDESQIDKMDTLALLSAYVEENSKFCKEKGNSFSWKEVLAHGKSKLKIRRSFLIQPIVSHTVKVLMHIAYRYRKDHKEELPQGPCIIVANHRSALDGFFITSKMRWRAVRDTFFFAKEKHLHSRFAHFMARKNNVILMDINKNVRESILQLSEVLKSGKNVIIFPEGTRSKDNKLNTFKDMFAILSKELNVPVIPIAISGSERAVYNHIYLPRPFAKVTVSFLDTIYPQNISADDIRKCVVEQISQCLEKCENGVRNIRGKSK